MLFNSYTFLAFFIIILVLHHLPLFSWKTKKVNLLLASYIFYAAWNPPFILLLWLSTVVDFFVGRALYKRENKRKKKMLLVISLMGNLGMLCFFKYGGFLLEKITVLVNAIGIEFHPAKPSIILPAGISFYTFTTLCYTIDMYKKESEPVKSLLDFSLFVTFFPHLVAGPIVRPPQLVPQFATPKQATRKQMLQGLFLISLGLFMKVVLADSMLSASSDAVFGWQQVLPTLDAWIGVLAFSGQIFFDFAGYSTCAVGAAMCLGFWLPQNFRYPYAAIGFSDFWKRWHITLSAWLRDYLYKPLGGNRKGSFRTYVNLMTTMLLGGLWHGANWTFVIWGGLNGFYLIFSLLTQRARNAFNTAIGLTRVPRLHSAISMVTTFALISIAWVFFRAHTLHDALHVLRAAIAFPTLHQIVPDAIRAEGISKFEVLYCFLLIAGLMTLELVSTRVNVIRQFRLQPAWVRWPVYYATCMAIWLLGISTEQAFIYFQF